MPKSKTLLIMFISALIPLGLELFYNTNIVGEGGVLYLFMWVMINYLFLSTIISIFSSYKKILSLPGLKIRKATYYTNMILYTLIIIFVNIYFSAMLFFPKDKLFQNLASPYVLIFLFIFYIMNLQFGNFPIKEDGQTNIYTILAKGSFKNGRDKYATVVGYYDDGIVLGDYYFPYESIKSCATAKKKIGIFIKGKDQFGTYRVNIDSLNSAARAVLILEDAAKNGKLDQNKLNFNS